MEHHDDFDEVGVKVDVLHDLPQAFVPDTVKCFLEADEVMGRGNFGVADVSLSAVLC